MARPQANSGSESWAGFGVSRARRSSRSSAERPICRFAVTMKGATLASCTRRRPRSSIRTALCRRIDSSRSTVRTPIPGTRRADRIDENQGALALALDFTPAQLEKLDAAADAVVGSRSADPNWVSQGRE